MEDINSAQEVKSTLVFDSVIDDDCIYTIAIPTYKRPSTLRLAIESAANQVKAPHYQILVVDNNPERRDETEVLIENLCVKNLRYYKNSQNVGMVGNWNKLYLLSTTKWVIMLHDDDILADNFMYVMNQFVTGKFGDYSVISPSYSVKRFRNSHHISDGKFKYKVMKPSDFILGNAVGAPLGLAIKKDYLIRLGGFTDEYYFSLDYHFYIKVAMDRQLCKIKGTPMASYIVEDNISLKDTTIAGFVKDKRSLCLDITHNCSFKYKLLERLTRYVSQLYILYGYNPTDTQLKNRFKLAGLKHKPSSLDKIITSCYSVFCRRVRNMGWSKIVIDL